MQRTIQNYPITEASIVQFGINTNDVYFNCGELGPALTAIFCRGKYTDIGKNNILMF
jgi:hypothetical protein